MLCACPVGVVERSEGPGDTITAFGVRLLRARYRQRRYE